MHNTYMHSSVHESVRPQSPAVWKQDAVEYFQHLLETRRGQNTPSAARMTTESMHARLEPNSVWFKQDVVEYFQYLLDIMARAERTAIGRLGGEPGGSDTPDAFRFGLETRIQVGAAS